MESTTYDEIIALGKAEGRAEGEAKASVKAIVTVLAARFGAVPAPLQKRLRAIRDPKLLAKLLKLAATCETISALSSALPADRGGKGR
jgi:hypothetical protein